MSSKSKLAETSPDQEIVATRLIDAPRALVFAAFKDPKHITHWWGPNGFSTTTYEMDVRVGGQWLFTMHGSDGTDYPNRVRYTDVREPELLAYDHDDGGKAERPLAFQVVITFTEEAQKTRVTLRLICGSKEQREMMAKFGAVEGAHQTLSRLEDYLLGGKPEARAARQGARS